MLGYVKPEKLTEDKTIEISESGDVSTLYSMAYLLKDSDKKEKVLFVPTCFTKRAKKILEEVGVDATVRNLSGTYRKQAYNK